MVLAGFQQLCSIQRGGQVMEYVEKDYALAVLRKAARGASLSAAMRIEEAYIKIEQSPAEKAEPIIEAEWIRD